MTETTSAKKRPGRRLRIVLITVGILVLVIALALYALYRYLTYDPLVEALGGEVIYQEIKYRNGGFVVETLTRYPPGVYEQLSDEEIQRALERREYVPDESEDSQSP